MTMLQNLQAKRAALRENEDGFTLIELLIVVVIIGILAAIAVPIYIGVTNGAKDSAAQSDLVAAKTSVIAAYSQNGSWTAISTTAATNVTAFGKFGWSGTTAVGDTSGTESQTSFCIKETSASTNVFYITESSAATTAKPTNCS